MNNCSNIVFKPLQSIFKGRVYDNVTKLIYSDSCNLSKPIGKVKAGKIFWFKK